MQGQKQKPRTANSERHLDRERVYSKTLLKEGMIWIFDHCIQKYLVTTGCHLEIYVFHTCTHFLSACFLCFLSSFWSIIFPITIILIFFWILMYWGLNSWKYSYENLKSWTYNNKNYDTIKTILLICPNWIPVTRISHSISRCIECWNNYYFCSPFSFKFYLSSRQNNVEPSTAMAWGIAILIASNFTILRNNL